MALLSEIAGDRSLDLFALNSEEVATLLSLKKRKQVYHNLERLVGNISRPPENRRFIRKAGLFGRKPEETSLIFSRSL